MRKAGFVLAGLIVLAGAVRAGEVVSAFDHTERNRPLDRILDNVLCPAGAAGDTGRLVLLLVDPTASLQRARFDAALRTALLRNAKRLGKTWFAVMDIEGRLVLAPTDESAAAADAVADLVAAPAATIQNVYAAVRKATERLLEFPGAREIVLVTLENGDAEDGLEKTVSVLRKAKVRLSAIAREAFLSDTWWYRREGAGRSGCRMRGAESAFLELPWLWILQRASPTEAVASGFPIYGLTRLAAATGGTVWLHYPSSGAASRCAPPANGCSCPHCRSDHSPCGEVYQAHRLRAIAPLVGPREEVGRIVARDPYFQAALTAWHRAGKRGIVVYEPATVRTGDGLREAEIERSHYVLLGDSIAFDVQAARARKLARACERILDDLNREMEYAEAIGGLPRYRALAETTAIMLRITRFNLLSLAAFCEEVGPEWEEQEMDTLPPPEVPALRSDYVYNRIFVNNLSLCHGLARYARMRLPGGRDMDLALAELSERLETFLARNGHTPWGQVVRRQCIASFTMSGSPKKGRPAPRWIPSPPSETTSTPGPQRPARAAPASGSSAGTATEGGR